ncbi:MAG: SpoIID/LytB domain-containing protein [Eubacteriales bacterium]|nr:SpoIID/LytB domain-containing protein [Eubacteriales bacterium]
MKKTRFLYGKKFLLAVLLIWLALLNEAFALNVSRQKDSIKEQEEKEKIENSKADEALEQKEQAEKAADETAEKENHKSQSQKESEPSPEDKTISDDRGGEVKETAGPVIRVLLMDTDYQSYEHSSVTLTVDGDAVTYTPESPELSNGPVEIEGGADGIEITSISRQEGCPVYQGNIKIQKHGQGLTIVNQLPLETYLEAVVPSEMPSSYEMEALMAQAVCARTYAWKQVEEGRLEEYGADVDDSVNYQVYQNIPPQERTTEAVRRTKGEVLRQDGELIEAYYFSTSAGVTSTDEIWGAQEAAAYLKSVECTFDSEEPWSKWSVNIPWDSLSQKAMELSGSTGVLKNIEIVKKNESGAVTCLQVVTEDGAYEVTEEYDIREFLSPQGCFVTEKDGTQTQGGKLLPSAYFTLEVTPGNGVSVSGGGYGHGVGMSQNAANQMAKENYTYEEIIDYFFKDVTIDTIVE